MSDETLNAKPIFLEALELPEADREAFIERATGGRPELIARVRDLMRAHEAAAGFLERPTNGGATPGSGGAGAPGSAPTPTFSTPAPAAAPAGLSDDTPPAIGPYRLLQRLGEGAFGEVWSAEQVEPVRRAVAIKILKRGLDTRQTLARFQGERQAVASLDHPCIARFIDAGETPDARPYFVMDLVRGVKITEHADANHLPIRDRVRLLAQAARAVQHAHEAGLVHRDLKPSNILVEVRDDEAVPRVIDFGIARALAGPSADATAGTVRGQVLGTPGYLAPEQAAGSADADARADVYSLGCVLYELISGSTPVPREELARLAVSEMARVLREREIAPPSERLGGLGAGLRTVARRRSVESSRLGDLVRGELDWVCAKAMARERQDRYDSASALADDLERWLEGRKVVAGPPRRPIGAVKRALRRHRRGVRRGAIGVGVLAVVVALAAGWVPGVPSVPEYLQGVVESYASGRRYGLPEGAWVNGMRVNRAGGQYSLVGGGRDNRAAHDYSMVGGGYYNNAGGKFSSVGGGSYNVAEGDHTTVAGGTSNRVIGHSSTISGGRGNNVIAVAAIIGGGERNRTLGTSSVIAGGTTNQANARWATVGGGLNNIAGMEEPSTEFGDAATVGGGIGNVAWAKQATVGGGLHNEACGQFTTIAGGRDNTIGTRSFAMEATLGATIGGGVSNRVSAPYAAIPGGTANVASGSASFAAGTRAQATHHGSFVWSDRTAEGQTPAASHAPDSFTARARGGFALFSSIGTAARLKPGEGAWSVDLAAGRRVEARGVDPAAVLAGVAQLDIAEFRSTPGGEAHLAPTAERVHEVFALGAADGTVLSTDLDGIALAAIQGLLARLEAQEAVIREQAARLDALEARRGG